jgi:hypothetical protein
MVAGKTYPVTVRLRNAGNAPWRASEGYRLVFTAPAAATPWTTGNTVALPAEVAPGAEVTFPVQRHCAAQHGCACGAVAHDARWRGGIRCCDAAGVGSGHGGLSRRAGRPGRTFHDVLRRERHRHRAVRNTGTHAWNVAGEPKVVLAATTTATPMPSKNYATGAIQPGQIATFSYKVGPMPHALYRVGGAIWMENISFLFKLPEASITVLTIGHCTPGTKACEQPY